MFTKETIFSMYVGKCKVRCNGISYFTGDADFVGINLNRNEPYQIWIKPEGKNEIPALMGHCTLLLKPLSKMSEEEIRTLTNDIYGIATVTMIAEVQNFLKDELLYTKLERVTDIIFWLLQHEYAISPELFRLGIAEEV